MRPLVVLSMSPVVTGNTGVNHQPVTPCHCQCHRNFQAQTADLAADDTLNRTGHTHYAEHWTGLRTAAIGCQCCAGAKLGLIVNNGQAAPG